MTDTKHSDESAFGMNNVHYVESQLRNYQQGENEVPQAWRDYFATNPSLNARMAASVPSPSFSPASIFNPPPNRANFQVSHATQARQERVDRLVHAYRSQGHRAARLDPLALAPRSSARLELEHFGLSEDEDHQVLYRAVPDGKPQSITLGSLRRRLADIYCGVIGFEYMHIDDFQVRDWFQERIEDTSNRSPLSRNLQLHVFTRLTDAVIFEQFVRKKYLGAKTFSLEGGETLIPLLDLALDQGVRDGTQEVVIGMAHRGRLNVLANIVGKRPVEIFREFEDQHPEWWRGRGDVKYHLGASGEWIACDGARVHVSLCFNPSHLEYVNPVAMGRVRAKQDRYRDTDRRHCLGILIHGDAAFAGEGIVQESLNMSRLGHYETGGTLHVIVNNQLGFTTPPEEGRSTEHATDVAKALQIPIFHVNGEHPQEVAQVVQLAMDFRAAFRRDVVINMYCYRRWGHNEADEPGFTQPIMYEAIEHRQSIRDSYLEHLLESEQVTRGEADRIADEHYALLDKHFQEAQTPQAHLPSQVPAGVWKSFCGGDEPPDDPETGIRPPQLSRLLEQISAPPSGFHLHKKLRRSVERRQQMATGERPIDWAAAEALAFATLAVEGHPVRLAGQDSARGTFSQRHAILHDVVDGRRVGIFDRLSTTQAEVEIINSPLSEAGALGFEYGFSLDRPEALVLWEAQYGDFANAAQVIIDQFLTSAEDKWRRLSGLVLLLPHGFEGQGPEHSSARLERFLSLAAEDNVQIACPSTPAQYFHVLRRQVKRKWRKPLVVLTPKSLLRHPDMASPLEDLGSGSFHRILGDTRNETTESSAVLLASGKMAYDLIEAREDRRRPDIAILRVEQFYPLADEALADALAGYAEETPVCWVQEEPENMGAGPYWRLRYCDRLLGRFPFSVVARPLSASPATGSSAAHKAEQEDLIDRAFQH